MKGVVIRSVPITSANYDSLGARVVLNPFDAKNTNFLPYELLNFFSGLYHEFQHGLEKRIFKVKDFVFLKTYLEMISGKLATTRDIITEWLNLPLEKALKYNGGKPLLWAGANVRTWFQDNEQVIRGWEETFDIKRSSDDLVVRTNVVMHQVGQRLIKQDVAYFDLGNRRELANRIMSSLFSEVAHSLLTPYRSFVPDDY